MYVTNCSADKTLTLEPVPPHQRYLSDRVWYVRQLAKDAGEDFAIVSGEFGLVFEDNCIPSYDHLLQKDEVLALGKEMAKQLKQRGTSSITFFVIPQEWQEGKPVHQYSLAMQYACNIAKIPFAIKPIDVPLGGRTKGEPTPVRPENIEIGGPYTMNKKATVFLLRAQDEKGLWQDVRKSTFLPDLQIKARMLAKKFPNQKVEITELPKDERFSF